MKNILLLVCGALALSACTDNFDEINTDKNSIATIGPAEMPFLFSRALAGVRWNDQTAQNLYADQYAQYFACNATYFATDRLVIVMDWAQDAFNNHYTGVMPQLQTILQNADPSSAEYALANIWWVYSFHRVTDYWGPVPYSSAGEPGISVPYDPQDQIYDDFFKRLDSAVTILEGKTGEQPFGSFDLIYGGDVSKWIKFANTLRLRLALRISGVDPARAKTEAETAFSAGVMTASPADDAYSQQSELDRNRISVMSDWNEFRMSATMESILKGYNDPRISEYFIPAVTTGEYDGLRNGLSTTQLAQDMNKAEANSHVGPRWTSPQSGGIASYNSTPSNVMCAAEAWFLRAEGALLGWNMGGTPKELYETGIRVSMNQWGITDDAIISAYINGTSAPVAPQDYLNSPPVTDVAVRFDASDPEVQKEQISIQKWLALFPDGWEAWSDNRRSRDFHLYPVANSDNPDLTDPSSQWIRRIPFLLSEKQNNGSEVEKATDLLGGPDKITTPLWWDIN